MKIFSRFVREKERSIKVAVIRCRKFKILPLFYVGINDMHVAMSQPGEALSY